MRKSHPATALLVDGSLHTELSADVVTNHRAASTKLCHTQRAQRVSVPASGAGLLSAHMTPIPLPACCLSMAIQQGPAPALLGHKGLLNPLLVALELFEGLLRGSGPPRAPSRRQALDDVLLQHTRAQARAG